MNAHHVHIIIPSLLIIIIFFPKGEGYVSKCAFGSRVAMSKFIKKSDFIYAHII